MVSNASMSQVQQWYEQHAAQLKPALKLLVAVCLLLAVYLLGQRLVTVSWLYAQGIGELPKAQTSAQKQSANATQSFAIENTHLFGRYDAPAASDTPSAKTDDAPETKLSLELQGVLVGPAEQVASAIIAQKGRSGQVYTIGASLPGGATLQEVHAQKVIIKYRGRLETLKFAEGAGTAGVVKVANEKDTSKHKNKRQAQTKAFDTMTPNSASRWLKGMGLRPVSDGSAQGYKINRPVGALAKAGLRRGDVVLSVNGQDLGNIEQDLMVAKQLNAGDELEVVVKRGEQIFTVRQQYN